MANARTARKKAQKQRKRERERSDFECIDFCELTRAEFIDAVKYIAMRKVRERGANDHKRGMETEGRFFSAFRRPDIRVPPWFFGVRKACAADDASGIDAFVVTDVGDIPVQIKSSARGMFRFNEERPGNNIPILIIGKDVSLDQILEKAVNKIERERLYRISYRQRRRSS